MATAPFLRNKYWILRHGKSIPNEKGLIVSSIENGTLPEYQLASEGVGQAQLAGEQFLKELKENSIPLENVRICYSPFSRTIHTAKVAASALNLPFENPQCKMMKDLRERYFGPSFELLSHDKKSGLLMRKIHSSGLKVEKALKICAVLVVSHGDPLQIFQTVMGAAMHENGSGSDELASRLQAAIAKPILAQHRKFALLTGELRAVV
ncbi:hypothetical protein SDJN02_01795, partial [Cucurbita argyrosperma subsp. argyrosperma]